NLVLARPVIDAVLFSLAIAVGITPQLLPAVVTTSRPGGPGGPVPDCDRAGQAAAVHRGGAAPTIGGAVPRRGGGAAHPAAPGPPRPLAGTPPAGTWAAPVARRSPGPRSDHYGALIGRPELPAWRVRRACRGELNCGRSRRPAGVRARWPNPRRAGRWPRPARAWRTGTPGRNGIAARAAPRPAPASPHPPPPLPAPGSPPAGGWPG